MAVRLRCETGTVHFATPDYTKIGNFGGVSMNAAEGSGVPVAVVRLRDVVKLSPVALLKIDVEGMERETLEGAANILKASRPVLYVENDRKGRSTALIE